MNRAYCNSCNAPIIWAISHIGGKKIPIDAAPLQEIDSPKGLFVLVKRLDPDPLAWGIAPDPDGLSGLKNKRVAVYRSHFATCPDADRHRKAA